MSAKLRSLPREFHRVDDDEPSRSRTLRTVERDWFGCEVDNVCEVAECNVTVAGELNSCGAVVTNAKQMRASWPIVTVMLGMSVRSVT